jgi:hypothetical protein
MNEMIRAKKIVGESSGMVMPKNLRSALAPSMDAAS